VDEVETPREQQGTVRVAFWFRLLGYICSGVSIFSLAHRYYSFGVGKIVGDLVRFYKALAYPFVEAAYTALAYLLSLISITLPHPNPDMVVLYLLLGAALGRAQQVIIPEHWTSAVITNIYSICLWPITAREHIRAIWRERRGINDYSRRVRDFYKGSLLTWAAQIVYSLLAFAVLFLINAAGPSIGL